VTEHLASVFLSYSWADKPLARGLAEGLDASGCRVWIDEGELRVGDNLVQSISEALDRVDFVVALVSAASVGSDWCRQRTLKLAVDATNAQHAEHLRRRAAAAAARDEAAIRHRQEVERGLSRLRFDDDG
jgi:hypothetical protein